jgi:hypothetical protein
MVLMMAMQEAGPHDKWPNILKGELENSCGKPRHPVGKVTK